MENVMEKDHLKTEKEIERTEKKKSTMGTLAIVVGVLFVTIFNLFFSLCPINGASMSPTLIDGDFVLVQDRVGNVEYGDVITIDASFAEGREGIRYIKRVVGMPGDTIEIKDNQFYRNDELVTEDYIAGDMIGVEDIKVTLGDEEVWVMGDNRNNSTDSRTYGAVPMTHVDGKATTILFPFDAIGSID